MIALASFFSVLAVVYLASLVGRHLRRQRKRQTWPAPYVVRDERADISAATRRSK